MNNSKITSPKSSGIFHLKPQVINKLVTIFSIIAPTLAIMILNLFMVCDDYFFHIRIGEKILNDGVYYHECFSWIGDKLNLQWINHEWLSEVLFAGVNYIIGKWTPYVIMTVVGVILYIIIFRYNKWHFMTKKWTYIVWSVVFVLFSKLIYTPRPHIFSFIFLALFLIILEEYWREKKPAKTLLLTIPLTLLWVNMHGGSAHLAWVLPLIYLSSSLLSRTPLKINGMRLHKLSTKKNLYLLGTSVVSLLLQFINPFGVQGFLYFFIKNPDEYKYISEWQPLRFGGVLGVASFAVIFLVFFMLLISKKYQLKDLLLLLAFVFLSLRSVRFIMLFFIVASVIIPKYIIERRSKDMCTKFVRLTILSFILLMTIIINNQKPEYTDYIPKKSFEVLDSYKPKRLYNDINIGENLIYAGYNCFGDCRCDLFYKNKIFTETCLFSSYDMETNRKENFDMEEFIEKYKFDGFLVTPDSGSDVYLSEKKYQRKYADEYVVYYTAEKME